MGHPQPATEVTLDNTTAVNFINGTLKQRHTKAMDMQYYWLQDQEAEKTFNFKWQKGADNKADYFTKHHPPTSHHLAVRPQYVLSLQSVTPHDLPVFRPLRGCANPSYFFQRTPDCHLFTVAAPAGPLVSQQSYPLL